MSWIEDYFFWKNKDLYWILFPFRNSQCNYISNPHCSWVSLDWKKKKIFFLILFQIQQQHHHSIWPTYKHSGWHRVNHTNGRSICCWWLCLIWHKHTGYHSNFPYTNIIRLVWNGVWQFIRCWLMTDYWSWTRL